MQLNLNAEYGGEEPPDIDKIKKKKLNHRVIKSSLLWNDHHPVVAGVPVYGSWVERLLISTICKKLCAAYWENKNIPKVLDNVCKLLFMTQHKWKCWSLVDAAYWENKNFHNLSLAFVRILHVSIDFEHLVTDVLPHSYLLERHGCLAIPYLI